MGQRAEVREYNKALPFYGYPVDIIAMNLSLSMLIFTFRYFLATNILHSTEILKLCWIVIWLLDVWGNHN